MDRLYDNIHLRGILLLNTETATGKPVKKPIYIAEYFGGDPTRSIAVYKVKKFNIKGSSKDYYDKDFDLVPKDNNPFRADTTLGKLASSAFKAKRTTVREYKLPIFVTTIVDGRDSFTGEEGPGFYEYGPGKSVLSKDGKHYTWEDGPKTGVFLSLNSFKWSEIPYTPKEVSSHAGVRSGSQGTYFEL